MGMTALYRPHYDARVGRCARLTVHALAAAAAVGALAAAGWARSDAPAPKANRLTVKATPSPARHGIVLTVRYTIAAPPACLDPRTAARRKACGWYVKQQARLILAFRSRGLIALIRPHTPTGRWSAADPGAAYAEWKTFVHDLDLQTLECTDHKRFSWKLTMIDPYRRPDLTRAGTYVSGVCPAG